MIYHFVVKSKPHKRMDLLIRASEYLPDKKKYSNGNGNMLFFKKSDETIWKPPF